MSVKIEDLIKGRQRLGYDGVSAPPPPRPEPPKPPPPPGPDALDLLNDLLRVASTAQWPLKPLLAGWIAVGAVAYLLLVGAWRALTWPWRRSRKTADTPVVNEAG